MKIVFSKSITSAKAGRVRPTSWAPWKSQLKLAMISAAVLGVALPAMNVQADMQQFRQGENSYAGAKDTFIAYRYPKSNFGYEAQVKTLGQKTLGLLHWDLKSIPSTAQIDGVNLTLNVANPSVSQFYLYAMPQAWREANVTWNALQPKLLDQPVLGTLQPNRKGEYSVELNAEGLAVVQAWIQGSPNNGFLIASENRSTDNLVFQSKEARRVNLRPKLEVSYSLDNITTPPPTPTPKLATYAGKCASCHGSLKSSDVAGSDASWIKDAIDFNAGGMGYLKSLSNADLNAIAVELGGQADLTVANPTATPAPTVKPTALPTAPPTTPPTATPTPLPKLATYAGKCANCHGTLKSSDVAGSDASWIKDAIVYNVGGMGYLKSLTNADLNAIAVELGGTADLTVANPTATPVPTVKPTATPTIKPTASPTAPPTSTPAPTVAPTPLPKLATYAGKCASCHGTLKSSDVAGSDASWIKDAIVYNVGGMGYLKSLTNADLNAIAVELGGKADLTVTNPIATPTPTPGGGVNPTATPKPTPTPSTSNNVVDVMALYTTANQTAAYAKQRLNLLVTSTNQAYKDSFVDMQIRLVHTEPTNYGDSKDNDTALDELSDGVGAFSGVEAKRAQYGADLVSLFRPYKYGFGSCGVAWLGMDNGSAANKKDGYSVVADGTDKGGTSYYCDDATFAHELGHNMGLDHERENSSGSKPIFPYAYAWGIDGTFGTIMGYSSPTLNYFSTPLLQTQCAGTPCGYPKTDSARGSDQSAVLNYTAPMISTFLPTTTDSPVLQ